MPARNAPLSDLETTALIQIRMRAALDPRYRGAIGRLIHLGLVEQRATGYFVTEAGEERCRTEARRLGLAA